MDITLEGKRDGIDAASSIQNELAIPVVYLTAHSDQATLDRAKLTRPYGYVLKPIREIELKIALEMALFAETRDSSSRRTGSHTQGLGTAAADSITGQSQFIRQELLKYPLFAKIENTLLNEISSRCAVKEYGALEIISLEEESQNGSDGFLVLSGRVAMLKTSLNGRELVVQLVGPANTFGLLGCLDSSSTDLTSRA